MMSHIYTALALLAIVGMLFVAVYFGGTGEINSIAGDAKTVQMAETNADLIDKQAPFFDLPDLSGNHVKISDFIGQPLVVVFWSTWNDGAADQMHILDQYLSSTDASKGLLKIIAIDSQEERSIVTAFVNRGGYGVQTLVDASGAISEEYHIKSLPTTYFIAKDGTIRDAYAGVLSEKMLVDKVEQILK